jgi:hypothetical protein
MLFSDEFFKALPAEPNAAALAVCKVAQNWMRRISATGLQSQDGESALELLAVLVEMKARDDHPYALPSPQTAVPDLVNALGQVIGHISTRASGEVQKHTFENMRASVSARFPKAFALEFTDGDIKRIQQLVNELREHISQSTHFEEEHRQRLLRRLERLQGELHKRMSDADRIFGLIGDAGVAFGKFGKDAKPIVDRIRELAQIAWKAQARAEELQSDAPFPVLEDKRDEE